MKLEKIETSIQRPMQTQAQAQAQAQAAQPQGQAAQPQGQSAQPQGQQQVETSVTDGNQDALEIISTTGDHNAIFKPWRARWDRRHH